LTNRRTFGDHSNSAIVETRQPVYQETARMTHEKSVAQGSRDHTDDGTCANNELNSLQHYCEHRDDRFGHLLGDLDDLSRTLDEVFAHVAGKGNPSLDDAIAIVSALRHVAAAPAPSRIALKNSAWVNSLSRIDAAIAQGQMLSELSQEIETEFCPGAWTFDTTPLLEALHAPKRSFFERFTKHHRKTRADLRAICRRQPPKKRDDLIALVEKLERAQTTRRMFVEQGAFLASVLGPLWNEFETNWDEAVALSKWTHVALSLLGRERLVEMAARTEDLALVQTYADSVEGIIRTITTGLAEVAGPSSFDSSPLDMAICHKTPVRALRQLLNERLQ
jgi:hypothetical protein